MVQKSKKKLKLTDKNEYFCTINLQPLNVINFSQLQKLKNNSHNYFIDYVIIIQNNVQESVLHVNDNYVF